MKKINCVLLLGVLLLAPATGWCSRWWTGHHDMLEVELTVTDAQGKPIPYPTVWEYVLPSANPLALDRDDLWRLTTRYRDSFEFASPFNTIVPDLEIPPMGDAAGHVRVEVDYSYLEGNDTPRPALMQVGYTIMKRGYLPGRIDFTVPDESHVEGKVVLQRDPDHAPETQPYMVTYERIRAELSDTRRNEQMTAGNAQREQHMREELEAAAEQAVAAGDKSAAARIYFRMQWLPSVTYINGRIAGWGQSDPTSKESLAYLAKACNLNGNNAYISGSCLFEKGYQEFGDNKYNRNTASEKQKQAFATYLKRLRLFVQMHGMQLWPDLHVTYVWWYRHSIDPNERAQILILLRQACDYEPKIMTQKSFTQTLFLIDKLSR